MAIAGLGGEDDWSGAVSSGLVLRASLDSIRETQVGTPFVRPIETLGLQPDRPESVSWREFLMRVFGVRPFVSACALLIALQGAAVAQEEAPANEETAAAEAAAGTVPSSGRARSRGRTAHR